MATKCELESKRILKYLNSDEIRMIFGREITWKIKKNDWNEFSYDIYTGMPTIPMGYAKKVFDFTIGCGVDITIATSTGWMHHERFSIPCFRISKH